jgi:hypothetical protein
MLRPLEVGFCLVVFIFFGLSATSAVGQSGQSDQAVKLRESPSSSDERPAWVEAMREVHSRSTGDSGVLMHLGDSITYSMAYFAPLATIDPTKLPDNVRRAYDRVNSYMHSDCYRWKGTDKGNDSGKTAAWAVDRLDGWIDGLNPEAVVIMFGTNDIRRGTVEDHSRALRQLVQRCLDRGVVVLLTTIPPMHGYEPQVQQAVEAQRRIAAELHVPLIDFYAHAVHRRPQDWDGATEAFREFEQWEVPTIISRDGVHPSNPATWRHDYSEAGLSRNGNVLRTYLTLMAYAEIIDVVFSEKAPSEITKKTLGVNPPPPFLSHDSNPTVQPDESSTPRPPIQDWFPKAPPLPDPVGEVINVGSVPELYDAAERIGEGGSICVRDGIYPMPRTLVLGANGVTLRSTSGKRDRVVLDFSEARHHEGIAITGCSDVTIADLTVANIRQNGIKINSNTGVDRVTIHNVVGHNVWQRHVKGVKSPDQNGQATFVEDCRVQYCLFYNDRPKRRGDDPWEDENPRMGFNYIGGMDVMSARGWQVRDNVFLNLNGKTGEARGAIFMWHFSTDCVLERNIIIDCDSGICLGNSSARGERRHAVNFLVRNNFIVRCRENNLLADHTRDCRIVHNTVHDPDSANGRLLRVVHANDGLVAAHNLFSGPRIIIEQVEGQIDIRDNLIRPVNDYFLDPQRGNLHLTDQALGAIDAVPAIAAVGDDIDDQPRGPLADLGADEFIPPINR